MTTQATTSPPPPEPDPLEVLRRELGDGTPDRGWCTRLRREMRRSLEGNWLDRTRWPVDLRRGFERWEEAELGRKLQAMPAEETP